MQQKRVSEGISVSQYVLSEEWNFLKMRVSGIRVKRIRVNQGLGVLPNLEKQKIQAGHSKVS